MQGQEPSWSLSAWRLGGLAPPGHRRTFLTFFPALPAAVCYPGADSKASSTGLRSAGAAGRCTLPGSASLSLLVLRPPLPFASVSSGPWGAVTWCRRSPLACCPAGAVSLDVAPRLPASFPLPASGSALALPLLPVSPSPAVPSAWSGIRAHPPPRFRRPPRLPCPARLTLPHPLSGPSGSHGHSPTPCLFSPPSAPSS